jgi:8-oxo-dGTP pyrophosphatase MutT (NUDIX family)/drug/metabolite transporter (DMT)-like permease
MDPLVAAAVLTASLLHACWHALVKTSGDQVTALAGMNLVSGCVAIALLPFASPLPALSFAIIVASVGLHVGYKLALARLYKSSDFGQAYPLARGLTPIMAAALAFLVMHEVPSGPLAFGIGLICLGLALLAFERRRQRLSIGALAPAAVVGLTVAAYSVVDAYGIRLSKDWFSFTIWLVSADSLTFVCYALVTRRRLALHAWAAEPGRVIASGLLGVTSFAVFMWALGRAPVGAVSALRETSVLFAALIGAIVLKESASWTRYAAALVVMSGISVIGLLRYRGQQMAETDNAERIKSYLDFAKERPELFHTPPGGVRILLDPDEIALVERAVGSSLVAKGLPSKQAQVGIVFRDPWFCVVRDAVEFPDGSRRTHARAINRIGNGAAALPVLDGKIVLLRHFRHAVRRWLLEIPRGGIEPGETPEQTMHTELREELGGRARVLIPLGFLHGSTNLYANGAHLFFAELDSIGAPALGEGIASIEQYSRAEFEDLLVHGEILDSFTVAAYTHAKLRGLI